MKSFRLSVASGSGSSGEMSRESSASGKISRSATFGRVRSLGGRQKSGGSGVVDDDEPKTTEEFKERSKAARLAADRLDEENAELAKEIRPVEKLLAEERRLDDAIRKERVFKAREEKRLTGARTEKSMYESGLNVENGNSAIEQSIFRIMDLEKAEIPLRDEYRALQKAIEDQHGMIQSLLKQVHDSEYIATPAARPMRKFETQYTPPEFKEFAHFKARIDAEADKIPGAPVTAVSVEEASAVMAKESTSGSTGNGRWHAAYPDSSRSALLNKTSSSDMKQSESSKRVSWTPEASVSRNTSASGGDVKGLFARFESGDIESSHSVKKEFDRETLAKMSPSGSVKERISRTMSEEEKKTPKGEYDREAMFGGSSSGKKLAAMFESGAVAEASRKEHEEKFRGKEFDAPALLERQHSSKGKHNPLHADNEKKVKSEYDREAEFGMSTSGKNLAAMFESGKVAEESAKQHENQFKGKEFDADAIMARKNSGKRNPLQI